MVDGSAVEPELPGDGGRRPSLPQEFPDRLRLLEGEDGAVLPADVHRVRDGLDVVRIDARLDLAEVVRLQAGRDGAALALVHRPVQPDAGPLRIALRRERPRPYPARGMVASVLHPVVGPRLGAMPQDIAEGSALHPSLAGVRPVGKVGLLPAPALA